MKARVLVADSDASLARVYCLLLAHRGYEVHTASNGLDCLLKLCDVLPDILLLDRDLLWGGADGVIARIRDGSDLPCPSVVLTTGEGSSDALASLLVPPVTACLQKPFGLRALQQALDAIEIQVPPDLSGRFQDSPHRGRVLA